MPPRPLPTPPPGPGPRPTPHPIIKSLCKTTNPNYRDCFGDKYFSIRTRFGTITGWRIKGKLSHTAAQLQDTLSKLITEKRGDWQSDRPEDGLSAFHEPKYTLISLFLGINESRASPYITVISGSKWFGKRLRKLILESYMLRAEPDWSCFRLPVRASFNSLDVALLDDKESSNICISGGSVPNRQGEAAAELSSQDPRVGNKIINAPPASDTQVRPPGTAHDSDRQGSPTQETFLIDESELDIEEDLAEPPPTPPPYD